MPSPEERRDSVDDARRALATRAPFRDLPAALREELAPSARVVHVGRGELLFAKGAPTEHLYLILRGLLQLRRTTAKGLPVLVGILGPGDLPGVPAILEGRAYPADAVVISEELRALRIPASLLVPRWESDLSVAVAMNRALLRHIEVLHEKVEVLSAGSVEQRLAALLLGLSHRFGDQLEDGVTSVPLALSRVELASCVSARVETVIRALSAWQREGIVRTAPGGLELLDLAALRAAIEGEPRSG